MTTYSAVLPTFTASTAGLKNAMDSVSTLMTNAGWALSADTGQMDITAVAYVSTSGTNYGYKIWYFNDSYHATQPVYLRMRWYMNASSSLGIAYTLGHSTDGAGNITGFKTGSDSSLIFSGAVASWGTASNASKASFIDGHSFWTLAPTTAFGTGPFFSFTRRWVDSTGAISTSGDWAFLYAGANGTGGPYATCMYRTASTVVAGNQYFCLVPYQQTVSVAAGTTDIFRHYHVSEEIWPSGSTLTYHAGEISTWTTFSCQPLTGGSARTYVATGIPRFANGNTGNTDCLAVLWE